jgi:hypothetical protein
MATFPAAAPVVLIFRRNFSYFMGNFRIVVLRRSVSKICILDKYRKTKQIFIVESKRAGRFLPALAG